jgi:hypothetical protein
VSRSHSAMSSTGSIWERQPPSEATDWRLHSRPAANRLLHSSFGNGRLLGTADSS